MTIIITSRLQSDFWRGLQVLQTCASGADCIVQWPKSTYLLHLRMFLLGNPLGFSGMRQTDAIGHKNLWSASWNLCTAIRLDQSWAKSSHQPQHDSTSLWSYQHTIPLGTESGLDRLKILQTRNQLSYSNYFACSIVAFLAFFHVIRSLMLNSFLWLFMHPHHPHPPSLLMSKQNLLSDVPFLFVPQRRSCPDSAHRETQPNPLPSDSVSAKSVYTLYGLSASGAPVGLRSRSRCCSQLED